jgi:hypothetical protein
MTGGAAPEITAGGVCMVAKLLHCMVATGSGRRSRLLRRSLAESEIKASLNSVDATAWLTSAGAPTTDLAVAGAACAAATVYWPGFSTTVRLPDVKDT